jgi:hypothetical protein
MALRAATIRATSVIAFDVITAEITDVLGSAFVAAARMGIWGDDVR